jgi:hypothetical protein
MNQALEDAAREYFGITKDCNRAGYILRNGDMLDFGYTKDGESNRYFDHSDVSVAFQEADVPYTGNEFQATPQFIDDTGAMRYDNKLAYAEMNIKREPTKKQWETFETCQCLEKPRDDTYTYYEFEFDHLTREMDRKEGKKNRHYTAASEDCILAKDDLKELVEKKRPNYF